MCLHGCWVLIVSLSVLYLMRRLIRHHTYPIRLMPLQTNQIKQSHSSAIRHRWRSAHRLYNGWTSTIRLSVGIFRQQQGTTSTNPRTTRVQSRKSSPLLHLLNAKGTKNKWDKSYGWTERRWSRKGEATFRQSTTGPSRFQTSSVKIWVGSHKSKPFPNGSLSETDAAFTDQ